MPLRLAEYGTCYRYEQSGELFGLMRVRCLLDGAAGTVYGALAVLLVMGVVHG